MSSLLLVELVAALWAIAVVGFSIVVVYRYTVSLHEDDSLHISAGEARFEAEQVKVLKQMTSLDGYCFRFGMVVLAMTVVFAGTWIYHAVVQRTLS
jgi:hypothetical protein